MIKRGASIERMMHPLFQAGEGGSIPTAPLSAKVLRVERVDFGTAMRMNRLWHSRFPRLGTGAVRDPDRRFTCFGAEHGGICYAVGIWSLPAARELPQDGTYLELRRMACAPDRPKNTASRMLRIMELLIRRMLPGVRRLCSTQDLAAHTGTIYRAAGWQKAGEPSKGRREWDCPSRRRPKAQSAAPKQRWEKAVK